MKQIIKINRNDIRQLVRETVYKTLLNEAKSVDSLIQSFVNKNPNINADELRQLFLADPTSTTNDRGSFVGKYATWIGNLYIQNKIKVGDIPELKTSLNVYNINKSQLPDIKTFKTLSDLINVIKDYSDDFKAERTISKGEQELEKVYEDNEWVVYIPHTYKASRKIGGDTNWCTASSDEYYFIYYTKQGPLYVNINKQTGEKYQFHFESAQFMDSGDDDIRSDVRSLINNDLWNFYCGLDTNNGLIMLGADKWYDFIGNIKHIYNEDSKMHALVDMSDFHIIGGWYSYIGDFIEGFARVCTESGENYINGDLELCLPPGNDIVETENFSNGRALVRYYDYTYNFLDTNFKPICKDNWDYAHDFGPEGLAAVNKRGRCTLIKKNGRILNKNFWVDYIDIFSCGFALVVDESNINYVDTNGKFLTRNWFRDGCPFRKGYAIVEIEKDKWNIIDTNGKFVRPDLVFHNKPVALKNGFEVDYQGRDCLMNFDGDIMYGKEGIISRKPKNI